MRLTIILIRRLRCRRGGSRWRGGGLLSRRCAGRRPRGGGRRRRLIDGRVRASEAKG